MKTTAIIFSTIALIVSISCNGQQTSETAAYTVRVAFKGASPSITDLFRAYCESQMDFIGARNADAEEMLKPAYNLICKGKSLHTDNGQIFDHKTVDLKNGYLSYCSGGAPPSGLEACFWNTANRTEKIFAVNFVHDHPDASHTFLLEFYRYNNEGQLMSPVNIWDLTGMSETEFTETYANTELRNVRFSLPQSGKDIDVGIGGFSESGDRYDGVDFFRWNGNGFTTDEPSSETSETDRIAALIVKLPEVKAIKNAVVSVEGLPSPAEAYCTVRVGEEVVYPDESHFVTIYWFRVYPNDEIRIYDVVTDSEMALDEWQKNIKL
jgi:hypothetical protein